MVIVSKGGFSAREHRRAFVNLALLRRLWNYVERHCIFIGEYRNHVGSAEPVWPRT